jgi:hypothetical protein
MKQMLLTLTFSSLAIALPPWAAAEKSHETLIAQTFVPAELSGNRDRAASPQVFALALPERAGEVFSMLSLSLQAQDAQAIPIPLDVKTAQIAVISASGQSQAIAIQQTWIDETGTLWLEFKPPLPPKTQLTLSLNAHKLPAKATYNYGIAAYANSEYPAPLLVKSGAMTLW